MQRKANVKAVAEFNIASDMNTIIFVNNGGLIMRNCLLSLRSLPKHVNKTFLIHPFLFFRFDKKSLASSQCNKLS